MKVILPIAFLLFSFYSNAQQFRDAPEISCFQSWNSNEWSHKRSQIEFSVKKAQQEDLSVKNSHFEIRFNNFPEQAKIAFEYAVSIWEHYLHSEVPIRLKADWTNLGGSVNGGITLGSVVASGEVKNFSGAPFKEIWYPIALAEKLARKELNNSNDYDINARFNDQVENWYFGLDGKASDDEVDFVTVVLHEIAHGLGFSSSLGLYTDDTYAFTEINIYDYGLIDLNDQFLIDVTIYPPRSKQLSAVLTGSNVFFESFLNKRLASFNPRIHAPKPFRSGSSISHLDESTYVAGNENSLMTPFLDEPIHEPGPFTLNIFAEMGWVHTFIDHEELPDSEIPYVSIKAKIESDTVLNEDEIYLHYSTDGFKSLSKILLSTSLSEVNEYVAEFPSHLDEVKFDYFFSVKTINGRSYTLPLDTANNPFSFYLGKDVREPTVAHTPMDVLFGAHSQLWIEAEIEDNIGVDSAWLTYWVNDEEEKIIPLERESGNRFMGMVQFPLGSLNDGDVVRYTIHARDKSSNQNVVISPGATSFYEVNVKLFQAVTSYSNDFDKNKNEFSSSQFFVGTETGFINNAFHSQHPYPKASGKEGDDLISVLAVPIVVEEEYPFITFDEVVLVEPGEKDAEFGSVGFKDYVIVEASSNLGETWEPLILGYDARDQEEWLKTYNERLVDGNSLSRGNRFLFVKREINLLESFSNGQEILVRFRLHSDSENTGWGWAIDNLNIQNKILGLEDFVSSQEVKIKLFPNPNNKELIKFEVPISGDYDLIICDSKGQQLKALRFHGEVKEVKSLDVSVFNKGLYLLIVKHKQFNVLERFVKL
ncbi:T9SS type A sorting domain-containing protein [Xanthovirga aplysinae]|uniref:T9SS type A sorting domain-containing protein n=1 Tax=Xanthovirga aplysinae TaxID=2529853 RepID=UPI0012BC9F03|nr:T9SS type A sorting domain-containing protein [Xanthovirga aplysinae]MTI31435.1 T9SS type A sorting domain-containing protein [Xanthovirga aplysinae]